MLFRSLVFYLVGFNVFFFGYICRFRVAGQISFIGCFFAFVFGVKCVEWRKEPSSHRLGLVLTGVLGLFLGYSYFSFHLFFGYFGLLTGFLAIITSGFSLLFEDDNA